MPIVPFPSCRSCPLVKRPQLPELRPPEGLDDRLLEVVGQLTKVIAQGALDVTAEVPAVLAEAQEGVVDVVLSTRLGSAAADSAMIRADAAVGA